LLSLSLSFMKYFDFAPFETPVVLDEFHLNLDIFHPAHIANMYLLAGKYIMMYSICSAGQVLF